MIIAANILATVLLIAGVVGMFLVSSLVTKSKHECREAQQPRVEVVVKSSKAVNMSNATDSVTWVTSADVHIDKVVELEHAS